MVHVGKLAGHRSDSHASFSGSHYTESAQAPVAQSDTPGAHERSTVVSGWRDFARDREQALKYLNCILRAQRWVHRRVDRVALVDSDVFVQNTSLDLTPPVEPPTFFLDAYPDAMVILPVMQITKRPLVHFDLRNEGNESVPLLTARQSRTLATLGMLVLADRVLEEAYQEGCLSYNVPGDDGEAADDGYSLNEDVRVDLDLENRPLARAALAPEAARAYRFVQQRIVDLVAEDADTGNAALDWFEYTSRGRNVEPGLEAEMAVLLW